MKTTTFFIVLLCTPLFLHSQTKNYASSTQAGIQNNVQNEVDIHDAQLMFFDHFLNESDTLVTAQKYFERSLGYYPSTLTTSAEDYLMDSFLFSDISLIPASKGWNGIYTAEILDNYLDNFFIRTKLPIIRTEGSNNYAHIEQFRPNAALAYKFSVQPDADYNIDFKVKKSILPNSTRSAAVIKFGYQLFDSNGVLLSTEMNSNCGSGFFCEGSPCFICRDTINVSNTNFLSAAINLQFSTDQNSNASYAKLIIQHATFGDLDISSANPNDWIGNGVDVDDIDVKENGIIINNNIGESDFENFEKKTTNWEYVRSLQSDITRLFEDRTSLLDELLAARNTIKNSVTTGVMPKTKIIPLLPKVQIWYDENAQVYKSNYEDQSSTSSHILYGLMEYYVTQLTTRFNTWENSQNIRDVGIEFAGLYFGDEDLRSGKKAILRPILEQIRGDLDNAGLKFFGSPFGIKKATTGTIDNCYNIETSFDSFFYENIFDVSFQQPGAFYFTTYDPDSDASTDNSINIDVDRDVLKGAYNSIIRPNSLGINIESRPFNFRGFSVPATYPVEEYSRVQDNYDYGKKLGFINYSKIYYDTNGANYKNSLAAEDSRERYDYDKLYEFIRDSRKGVVINGGFEELDDIAAPYNWEVPAAYKVDNRFSTTQNRFTQFNATTSKPEHHSDTVPVTPFEKVHISMRVKEFPNDNVDWSGLFGVRFFDKNNTEITTIATGSSNTNLWGYSTPLGAFYRSLNTSTTFQEEYIYFTIPWNAVKMTFFLKKNMNADVIYKDVKMHRDNINNEPDIFYTYPTEGLLQKEEPIDKGVHYLGLDYNQSAHTSEKISINPGRDYVLKIDHRQEVSPQMGSGNNNKALIGIRAYGKNGLAITTSGAITGLSCCSSGYLNGLYWTYINTLSPNWKSFTSNNFQFSNDVASIKIYVANWYHDNTVFLDNVSLEYANDSFKPKVFPENNILKKEKWNESFPITANWREPVYYSELIGNSGESDYGFKAWYKSDVKEEDNSRILAVEYLDENYNLLTDVDITSAQTGLLYSSYYRYWHPSDIDIDSEDCNSEDIDGVSGVWWNDQWEEHIRSFTAPSEVKYIRLSIQKLDDGSTLKVLNPILTTNSLGGGLGDKTAVASKTLSVPEVPEASFLKIYPNPTDQNVTVSFKEMVEGNTRYTIVDITGKIVQQGDLRERSTTINLENLSSGIYLINIANNSLNVTEKIIKK